MRQTKSTTALMPAIRQVSDPKRHKISRLRSGKKPRVLDLFAGCGGLSLGCHLAGFEPVCAIELDAHAAMTHAINFFKQCSPSDRDRHAIPRDIVTTEPADFVQELGLDNPKTGIDVIVGGPPCQAYARVGRAKLREVAEHPEAFLRDPRSNLYLRYLCYVRELQPLAIVMENVPDALNHGGHNIADETCEALTELGYECRYTLLNSAFYGVPQMRERMFLIGLAKELRMPVTFPAPTHWIELPRGYEGTRAVALKALLNGNGHGAGLFDEPASFYSPSPKPSPGLVPAVTAQEALCDLPKITIHLEGKLQRGARRFDEVIPYPKTSRPSAYAKLMRSWPGFENEVGVADHVIRYLPRDYSLFKVLQPGDEYPQAHSRALELFEERLTELAATGVSFKKGGEKYLQLKKSIVPPYDPGKFPNKWRKMEADRPARTLMAHLGKDCYSHIHYDSTQARTISVREAARLQSFPDGFVFSGTMNPAFRQIGNAVPPLLAAAVAKEVMKGLQGK